MRKQLPHRGEQFSVDDDPTEVETDRIPLPPTTPTQQSFSTSRHQSTVRRRTQAVATLPRVDSAEEEAEQRTLDEQEPEQLPQETEEQASPDEIDEIEGELADSEDPDLSDTESFTLRDRQLAINETHPSVSEYGSLPSTKRIVRWRRLLKKIFIHPPVRS